MKTDFRGTAFYESTLVGQKVIIKEPAWEKFRDLFTNHGLRPNDRFIVTEDSEAELSPNQHTRGRTITAQTTEGKIISGQATMFEMLAP